MGSRQQFKLFLVVGIISTLCNLSSRYLFQIAVSYEIALVGANTVGVVTAFVMNRWFVFRSQNQRYLAELFRFVVVNLFGIALSWVTAVLLYRYVMPALGFHWHPDLVAHAIGIAVPVLPNYFAHKWWTFTK